MKERVRRYSSYDTDFEKTKNEDFKVAEGYHWILRRPIDRVISGVLYGVALFISFFYLRFFLRIRIVGRDKLKESRGEGIFLYANHTQPIGDVLLPAHAVFPKRIYTVVSPANLGIPVIGKLLPHLGALPLTDSLSGLRELSAAIKEHISSGRCVVIYPEAHVWAYYTGIRPISPMSFSHPARLGNAVYCMTLTYQRSRFFSRPRATAYIDGPFFGEGKSVRSREEDLCRQVVECMNERARASNTEYIKYIKE